MKSSSHKIDITDLEGFLIPGRQRASRHTLCELNWSSLPTWEKERDILQGCTKELLKPHFVAVGF